MKIVDVVLNIDGLKLNDGESVDDVVKAITERFDVGYDVLYEVTYEEEVADD